MRIEMKNRQIRSVTSEADTEGPPPEPSKPSVDSRLPDSVGRVRTSWLMVGFFLRYRSGAGNRTAWRTGW